MFVTQGPNPGMLSWKRNALTTVLSERTPKPAEKSLCVSVEIFLLSVTVLVRTVAVNRSFTALAHLVGRDMTSENSASERAV
ncbi:hypothetical protein AVEN_224215-1 [Araneus ventricosus]|uniref:Uncharacterized protein n=1 Tax=Araneus ventricosus TaxID=182803 RepID=A0A4Y2EJX0_ARAVE|nr:hypothetical protein AVEN_224215-1 [Araneus ventricosus]